MVPRGFIFTVTFHLSLLFIYFSTQFLAWPALEVKSLIQDHSCQCPFIPIPGDVQTLSGSPRPKGRVSVSFTSHVRPLVMWDLKSFKHNNGFPSERTKVSPSVTTMVSMWLECMFASCEVIVAGMWELRENIIASWDLTHALWMYGSKNMQIPFQ